MKNTCKNHIQMYMQKFVLFWLHFDVFSFFLQTHHTSKTLRTFWGKVFLAFLVEYF